MFRKCCYENFVGCKARSTWHGIDHSVLCTRLSKCTEQDWTKLRRLLHFLQSTIDDKRVLTADSLTELYTWVDAAYAVHDDRKSHIGGAMLFGCGDSVQSQPNKNSTPNQAEVVGVSDYLPSNIWTENFW